MPRKRFVTVDELVNELSEDPDFIAVYNRAIEASRIVGMLSVARVARGLKPADVDAATGFKPGTTSRLERQEDNACKVGELRRFAAAVGYSIEIKTIFSRECGI